MVFVTIKTPREGRRIEVPSTNPRVGVNGTVRVYARCDVNVEAYRAYKIIDDIQNLRVPPGGKPAPAASLTYWVGVPEQSYSAGEYGEFIVGGLVDQLILSNAVNSTEVNKALLVAASGANHFAVGSNSHHRRAFGVITGTKRNHATQLKVMLAGRMVYT